MPEEIIRPMPKLFSLNGAYGSKNNKNIFGNFLQICNYISFLFAVKYMDAKIVAIGTILCENTF
jgi:hypothetical protein